MKMILAPIFTLLAFIFALLVPIDFAYKIEWFLFGLDFRVDYIAKQFLLFTTFVWFISAIYAFFSIKSRHKEYLIWFLLTFLGNFGLCFSYDAFGFYMFFSIMTFSAFGMIIYDKTQEAKKAAFIYIKYAIFGEILIFLGLISSVYSYGGITFEYFGTNNINTFTILLLVFGFGIKAGMFLLHSWLPLAHSAAPVSSSAVLSGVMLKTGILGWLRFMPNIQDDIVGYILIISGILAIFGGIYGVTQNKIKVVLAYSSISQMGYLVVLFGLYVLNPIDKYLILNAMIFFMIHHAINKSSLFLLSGEIIQNGLTKLNMILVLIPIVSMIGVPLSSGMIAKEFIKNTTDSTILIVLISLSSFITALLMVRFFVLSMQLSPLNSQKSVSFVVLPLIPVSFILPFTTTYDFSFDIMQILPLVVVMLLFYYIEKNGIKIPYLPQGDMLVFIEKIGLNFHIKKDTNISNPHHINQKVNMFLLIENYLQNQKLVFLIVMIWVVILSAFLLYI